MTAPIVSVIVANYNAEAFLEACLRSVLTQDMPDIEVLVVDDLSTDTSVAIARRIADEDPRVRVVACTTNGGPAAARNAGLRLARGRWVAIVDSDDLIHPHRLSALVAAAETAGADMVADDLLVFVDGAANPPARFLNAADRDAPFWLDLQEYLRRSVLYGPEPAPGFLKPLIRRDRLIAAGLAYDETLRIAEDDDLVIRLLLAELRYLVVPAPWYFYRKHGRSISHRLSLSAVEAMQAADQRVLGAVLARRPDLARECAIRRRALDRVAAFETLIQALKRRAPLEAARTVAATPAVLAMLRMPILGRLRRIAARRAAPSIEQDVQHRRLLAAAEAAGARAA